MHRDQQQEQQLAQLLVEEAWCDSLDEALAIVSLGNDGDDASELLQEYLGLTDDVAMSLLKRVKQSEDHDETSDNESDDDGHESPSSSSSDAYQDFAVEEEEEVSLGPGECILCERDMHLTRHHLLPKSTWARLEQRLTKGMEGVDEGLRHLLSLLNNDDNDKTTPRAVIRSQTIDICRPCHNHIHKTYDNWTLTLQYNTLDKLLRDPAIRKYAKWASQQRSGRYGSSSGMVVMGRRNRRRKA